MIGRLLTGGAGLLGGLPIWAWLVLGLSVSLAGVEGLRRVQTGSLRAEVAQEREGRAKDRETALAAALKQAEENAKETARRLKAQKEIDDEYQRSMAAANRDAAAARDAAGRLRVQLAAFAAAGRAAPGHPAAAGVGPPAGDAVGVLADLLRSADERAGALAEYADAARASGQQCQRAYEALTP